jgi:hypothetical protein
LRLTVASPVSPKHPVNSQQADEWLPSAVYDLAVSDVRAEIERQAELDANWQGYADVLEARMVAVRDARRAFALQEVGGAWAYRQSLIDLAAVAELLAGELPPPPIPSRQTGAARLGPRG